LQHKDEKRKARKELSCLPRFCKDACFINEEMSEQSNTNGTRTKKETKEGKQRTDKKNEVRKNRKLPRQTSHK
jgi:hypothetical protein